MRARKNQAHLEAKAQAAGVAPRGMRAEDVSALFQKVADFLREKETELRKDNDGGNWFSQGYQAISTEMFRDMGLEHAINWLQLRSEFRGCADEARRFLSLVDDADEASLPSQAADPSADLAFLKRHDLFCQMQHAANLFDAIAAAVYAIPKKGKTRSGRHPYSKEEVNRIEKAIVANGGSLILAATHLGMDHRRVKRIHEAARKRTARHPCNRVK